MLVHRCKSKYTILSVVFVYGVLKNMESLKGILLFAKYRILVYATFRKLIFPPFLCFELDRTRSVTYIISPIIYSIIESILLSV